MTSSTVVGSVGLTMKLMKLIPVIERVGHGAVADVPAIDGHVDLVHAFHDARAEIAEPFVVRLEGAVAQQVAKVIGHLAGTLAQSVERVYILDAVEMSGILQPENDAVAAARFVSRERKRRVGSSSGGAYPACPGGRGTGPTCR